MKQVKPLRAPLVLPIKCLSLIKTLIAFCLLFAASISCILQTAQATEIRKQEWAESVAGSKNLFRVTPSFYRSAQLKQDDLPLMQRLGIKTIVSLRAFHSDKKLFGASGIKLIRIPFYTWDIDDEHVAQAMRALKDAEQDGAVLLHCQHGADRTGLITAMYRVLYQQWEREQAIEELMNGGYGYHAMWKNIPRYLRRVDIENIRRMIAQGK